MYVPRETERRTMCRILNLIKEASELCNPSASERAFIDYILGHLDKGGVLQLNEITLELTRHSRQPGEFYFNDEDVIIDDLGYITNLIMLLSQLVCLLCVNMNIIELTFIWDFIKYVNRLEFYKKNEVYHE